MKTLLSLLFLAALAGAQGGGCPGAQGGGVQQAKPVTDLCSGLTGWEECEVLPSERLAQAERNLFNAERDVEDARYFLGIANDHLRRNWAALMPIVEPLPPPTLHSAMLVEATWKLTKSGFAAVKPCNPPVPEGSYIGCSEDLYTEQWICPSEAVAAFPEQTNPLYDWEAYHKRGGKVWCLLP